MAQMIDDFVAAARSLFEAAPGSEAQRSAHEWLLAFQQSADSWHVALRLLELSTGEANDQISPTVLVVTLQLLRFKIANAWGLLSHHDRELVRKATVQWLHRAATAGAGAAYAPAIRTCCVMVAEVIVRSDIKEWPRWHHDVKGLFQPQPPAVVSPMLLEIYTAIPIHLRDHVSSVGQERLQEFAVIQDEVVSCVIQTLAAGGSLCEAAVRCVESWALGVPFGEHRLAITMATMTKTELLARLIALVMGEGDPLAQAAGEIVADVVSSSVTDTATPSDDTIDAVVSVILHLVSCRERLVRSRNDGPPLSIDTESVLHRGRTLSKITSAIALHHAVVIFSPSAAVRFTSLAPASSISLATVFLELMLEWTSVPDCETAQPTLEFWFFLLDDTSPGAGQRSLLSAVVPFDQLVDILDRVVNALIQRCRYPDSFLVNGHTEGDDGDDVDSVIQLRKEIADTLISLFSKWPMSPATDKGVSCVKGMAALLHTSKDAATLDAVLFLLERCIELFDIDSSDSDEDDDDDDDGGGFETQSSNEGVFVLQQIALAPTQLPIHRALMQGTASFIRSLSKVLVLPGEIYVQVALFLCHGLEMEASCGIAADALRWMSKTIVQHSDVDERAELLTVLASKCMPLPQNLEAACDLVEASFRLTEGTNDAEFASFCNHVLAKSTHDLSSTDPATVAHAVSILGRAVSGVELPSRGVALTDQVWPLLSAATASHSTSLGVREAALRFFCDAVASNPETPVSRHLDVAHFCLHWLPHSSSPSTLRCLAAVIANISEARRPELEGVAAQVTQTAVQVCFNRIHFDASEEDRTNHARLDEVFASHQVTQQVAPELVAFFVLATVLVQHMPGSWRDGGSASLISSLRLAWLLLDVNHQVQEICDVVCDFLLAVCSSSELLTSSVASSALAAASGPLLRAVLGYFGPKCRYYRQRNLWQFLFQLLHAPRVVKSVQAHFHACLVHVLTHDGVLSPPLSQQQAAALATDLTRTNQRHRFMPRLNQAAKLLGA